MTKTQQLIAKREEAMEKVRAWWDAGTLAGQLRDHTKAPAWKEYLAAFAALDEARTANEELEREDARQIGRAALKAAGLSFSSTECAPSEIVEGSQS